MKSERSQLNNGWQTVKFGDVVKNANLVERDPFGSGIERIVGLENIDPENLHIRRWDSPEEGTSFTRKFVPGQILFGKRRAYQRKVAFAEFESICSGDILTFESKNPKLFLPELLPFICQTDVFFNHALGTSAGSLSPRTSWSALQDFKFPLPPLEEQKRIAEILWATDETVERHIEVKHSMEFLRNKFFIEKCLLGLTQQEMKDLNLTGHGWPVKRIRDCIKISSRKSTPPHKKAEYLSLENLDSGRFHITHKGNSKNVKSTCSIYERGDLLYGKLRPNLDKAVIADREGVCSTEMLVITAKEITTNQFLLYHFHCPKFVHIMLIVLLAQRCLELQ